MLERACPCVTTYRVPLGATFTPDDVPERFEPGWVLAKAAHSALADGDPDEGTRQIQVETPWGELTVEARGAGSLLVELPRMEIAVERTLLSATAMQLGLAPATIEQTRSTIQVVDVGRQVLVAPLPDGDEVRNAPENADPSKAPQIDTKEAVAYAVTQRTPYVKILGRLWGPAEPLSALAAAAVHLVRSGTLRATYPRTRIVGQIVPGEGDERCEITVQAKKIQDKPKLERLLVGGKVAAVSSG